MRYFMPALKFSSAALPSELKSSCRSLKADSCLFWSDFSFCITASTRSKSFKAFASL